jgi:hypothetical protein
MSRAPHADVDAGPSEGAARSPFDASADSAAAAAAEDASVAEAPPVACRWVDVWHPSMKHIRKPARRFLDENLLGAPTAITCCSMTARSALCRASFHGAATNHTVGLAIGTRLVGVTEDSATAWLDVPVEVDVYQSMKQHNPPWAVALKVVVSGNELTLERAYGQCPRPCAATPGGCQSWNIEARKCCDAIGSYRLVGDELQRR